jgi:hypothetical protein
MKLTAKIGLLSLGLIGLSTARASAQLVVTAPVLEVQSGFQTVLQNTMKGLSSAANVLVDKGVQEQTLTQVFSEKNMVMAKTWYDGLESISSAVRNYRRVQNIFTKQSSIISQYSDVIMQLRQSPYISPQQLADMTTMYGKMMGESANTISDLQIIVSPAMLKMTDAERMKFIDQLDAKITDQANLVNYYTQRNLMQIRTAKQNAQDVMALKAFVTNK